MGQQCTRQSKSYVPAQNQTRNASLPYQSTQSEQDSFQINFNNEQTTFSQENIQSIYNLEPQILAKGQFGSVRIGSLKAYPKKKFAVKTISKEKIKSNIQMLINEVEILKNCDHPNIVQFHETYEDDNFLYLVLQLCKGGQLQQDQQQERCQLVTIKDFNNEDKQLNIYSEEQTRNLMYKILSAVKYMHSRGIVHRDLKLDNFVFMDKTEQNFELRLIDFGLSEKFSGNSDKMRSLAGALMFMAPEILQKEGYTKACDYWSSGVIMYNLLSGEYPFFSVNEDELLEQIKNANFNFNSEVWNKQKISKDAKDLIKKLLHSNYKERITASQALEHPFFKKTINDKISCMKKIYPTIITTLSQFKPIPELKYLAFKVLLSLVDDQIIKPYRSYFKLIDFDNDGMLSLQDLQNCEREYRKNHQKKLPKNFEQIVQNLAKNQENKKYISYSSFLIVFLEKHTELLDKYNDILFNIFDIDRTGMLSKQNLASALTREGRKLDQEHIDQIIDQVDYQHHDHITKQEFTNLLYGISPNENQKKEKSGQNLHLNVNSEVISLAKKNSTSTLNSNKAHPPSDNNDDKQKKQQLPENEQTELDMKFFSKIQEFDIKDDTVCHSYRSNYQHTNIYHHNSKNTSKNRQYNSHKQCVRQDNRHNTKVEFDNQDFEQKIIDDQFLNRKNAFDVNSDQQRQSLMKRFNYLERSQQIKTQSEGTPCKFNPSGYKLHSFNNNNIFSKHFGGNMGDDKSEKIDSPTSTYSLRLNNKVTDLRKNESMNTPQTKKKSNFNCQDIEPSSYLTNQSNSNNSNSNNNNYTEQPIKEVNEDLEAQNHQSHIYDKNHETNENQYKNQSNFNNNSQGSLSSYTNDKKEVNSRDSQQISSKNNINNNNRNIQSYIKSKNNSLDKNNNYINTNKNNNVNVSANKEKVFNIKQDMRKIRSDNSKQVSN